MFDLLFPDLSIYFQLYFSFISSNKDMLTPTFPNHISAFKNSDAVGAGP